MSKRNAMKVQRISIERLREYDANIMSHGPEHVQEIAESIARFGFNDPVAVGPDMVLIEGHGRLAAARLLGMKEVPCIVLSDMSEDSVRAYRIAHNKIAKNSVFDLEALRSELDALEGAGFDGMGFSEDELSALLQDSDNDILPDDGGYWSGVDMRTAGRGVPLQIGGELQEVGSSDYAGKNREIDVDSLGSEMVIKLKFSEAEYWLVRNAIDASGMSAEDVMKNAVGL